MARPRVVLAGYGFAGRVRHRLGWLRDGRVELVGVIDPDPGARREAERHGLVAVDGLRHLASMGPDLVSVCTPPDHHVETAIAAMEAGADVVVEKPLAPTVADCDALIARADALGRRVDVGHNFRFSDAWRQLHRWIDRGDLGQVQQVEFHMTSGAGRTVPPWTGAMPGGLLGDELPHAVYLLSDLLGPLRIDHAWGDRSGPRLQTVLRAEDDRIGLISAWLDGPRTEWWIAVGGTDGIALLDLFRDSATWVPGERSRTYRTISEAPLRAGASLVQAVARQAARRVMGRHLYGTGALLSAILDARHAGAPPVVPLTEGRDTVALQQALLDGAGLR